MIWTWYVMYSESNFAVRVHDIMMPLEFKFPT